MNVEEMSLMLEILQNNERRLICLRKTFEVCTRLEYHLLYQHELSHILNITKS